jgi:hypothetical protein
MLHLVILFESGFFLLILGKKRTLVPSRRHSPEKKEEEGALSKHVLWAPPTIHEDFDRRSPCISQGNTNRDYNSIQLVGCR